MTGSLLHLSIKDDQISGAIHRLDQLVGPSRMGLMRAIGVALVETTQRRFDTATSPDGQAWKGLSPAYAAVKTGPGILREAGMRGGLQGSITFRVAGASEVEIGTDKVYGAIHQFGGTIKPKNAKVLSFRMGQVWYHARSVTLPARPYLGFGPEDLEATQDVVNFFVSRLLRGA